MSDLLAAIQQDASRDASHWGWWARGWKTVTDSEADALRDNPSVTVRSLGDLATEHFAILHPSFDVRARYCRQMVIQQEQAK